MHKERKGTFAPPPLKLPLEEEEEKWGESFSFRWRERGRNCCSADLRKKSAAPALEGDGEKSSDIMPPPPFSFHIYTPGFPLSHPMVLGREIGRHCSQAEQEQGGRKSRKELRSGIQQRC